MSLVSLQNSSEQEVTILSNRFIDNFMPRANGEFVKVYIYLLRMVSAAVPVIRSAHSGVLGIPSFSPYI